MISGQALALRNGTQLFTEHLRRQFFHMASSLINQGSQVFGSAHPITPRDVEKIEVIRSSLFIHLQPLIRRAHFILNSAGCFVSDLGFDPCVLVEARLIVIRVDMLLRRIGDDRIALICQRQLKSDPLPC
ncbi:hypothetical protein BKM16_28715 [Pseudomonas amygdali pv. morsprunorum]|nr:hypothetical protein BKM22_28705 [Pseudomonas amygdali pv. morsprunorum]POD35122.1 hypothetical protein BKM16_28715 [Pseudomonas amygdali pv. morsprunorum]